MAHCPARERTANLSSRYSSMITTGTLLEELNWPQAAAALSGETIVVIPIGAAAKKHGPHLRLNNDWTIAEHLKRRVLEVAKASEAAK